MQKRESSSEPGNSGTSVTSFKCPRAVFNATAHFHNPAHAAEWNDAKIDTALEDVWSLVARGLA